MLSQTCKYCTMNHEVTDVMIYICDLTASKLYLYREQSNPGRCVIAYREHANELHDLDEKELAAFASDMKTVGNALRKAFAPKKVNYGMFNDLGDHLHCHIVPKYEGGYAFGSMFQMNPEPAKLLSDEEYAEIIEKIKANL